IAVYQGLKKWELMQEIAKRLAESQPDDIQWTISLAYATRRADSIKAAKEILLNAEPKFPKEGIIKYNLPCYSCQTGDIETAKNYLKKAFEINSSWRLNALNGEDLKPMSDSLQSSTEISAVVLALGLRHGRFILRRPLASPHLLCEGDEAAVALVGAQERTFQQLEHTAVVRRPGVLQPLEHLLRLPAQGIDLGDLTAAAVGVFVNQLLQCRVGL